MLTDFKDLQALAKRRPRARGLTMLEADQFVRRGNFAVALSINK